MPGNCRPVSLILAAAMALGVGCKKDQPLGPGGLETSTANPAADGSVASDQMPRKEVQFEKAAADLTTVLSAHAGERICFERSLAEEDRFVASVRESCSRADQSVTRSLYDPARPEQELVSFRRLVDYSDELDALILDGVVRDGATVEGPTGSGPPYYTGLFDLKASKLLESSERPGDRVAFVDGASKVVSPPSGLTARWNEGLKRVTWQSRGCVFGALTEAGEWKCFVEHAGDDLELEWVWSWDDWVVVATRRPTQSAFAVRLEDAKRVEITAGTCEEPRPLLVGEQPARPGFVWTCGPPGRGTVHYWTPEATRQVVGEGWATGFMAGDFVDLIDLRDPTDPASDHRLLDLRTRKAWDMGSLSLAGAQVVWTRSPMAPRPEEEVFYIEPEERALVPLGSVSCDGEPFVTWGGAEGVVSVLCTGEPTPCGDTTGQKVVKSVTWDIDSAKRYETSGVLVGVTRKSLVFADTAAAAAGEACETKRLDVVRR